MPLSEPSGGASVFGGIGGGAVMARYPIRNTGADTAINFQKIQWDDVSSRLIVAGNNDFIGSMASAQSKLVQAPTLPTVVSSYQGISVRDSGEVVIVNGNDVWLGDSDLDNWSDITPPAVLTRRGAFAMAGSTRLYTLEGVVNPEIEFSDDNGATWSAGAGNLNITGFTAAPTAWAQTRDRSGIAIASNTQIAIALSANDVDTDNWTVLSLVDFLAINARFVAWSDDETAIIVAAQNGTVNRVNVTGGSIASYALADNFFRQTASNGIGPECCAYVPDLEGFLLGLNSQEQVCLIPDSAPTTMQQGFLMATASPTLAFNFGSPESAVDGDGIMLAVGNTNLGAIYVPAAS